MQKCRKTFQKRETKLDEVGQKQSKICKLQQHRLGIRTE